MQDSEVVRRANIEALERVQPGFVLPPAGEAVRVEGGGQATLALRTPDGRWIHVHSRRDAAAEADRQTAPIFDHGEAPPALLVLGPGLGHVLESIERRAPLTRVVAIEPMPGCAAAMLGRRDWRDAIRSGRLMLLVGPHYAGDVDAWRLLDAQGLAPTVLVSPVLAREFPADLVQARAVADRVAFGARANADARRRFAARYLLNTLVNAPAIVGGGDVRDLHGACSGLPCVLAAAGPSLDRRLAELRSVGEQAVVIAVDTAVRPLLAAGVRPHLAVGLDPSEGNARNLAGLEDSAGVTLVTEGSLEAAAVHPFTRSTFFFQVSGHHPWPWFASHGVERGLLRSWGSVLTSALDLASVLGCSPVVFIGADLAYTRGLPYCRHTVWEDPHGAAATDEERAAAFADRLREKAPIPITDIGGQPVPSAPHFVQFRDWLLRQCALRPGRDAFNATGGGILAGDGITQVETIREALGGGRAVTDVRARLKSLHDDPRTRARGRGRLTPGTLRGLRGSLPLEEWRDWAASELDANAFRQRVALATRGW
jgi:hypothetical protein